MLPRTVPQLAAGVIAVVLAVAVAAVALELHYGTGLTGSASAASIKAYQAIVKRDYAQQDEARNATSAYCSTLESSCRAPGRPVLAALQRWLGDLNRSRPPSRFVVIDAQLRRHLMANISDLNAMFAAHQARDQNVLDRDYKAALSQRYWFDTVAESIVRSQPVNAATYIDSVRSMKQTLGACVSWTSSCRTDVLVATPLLAGFEASLVRNAAPSSLAAQNRQLQQDLAQADTALLVMANTEVTDDQTALNSARLSLQQAWLAVDADIAAILGS